MSPWYRRPAARVILAVLLSSIGITVLGGGILALMEGAAQTGRRLIELSPGWLALSLGVWMTSLGVQGLRWRALLPVRSRPPAAMLAWVVFGANALSLALPGPVGEFAAAWYLRHRYGVPMVTALAAALLARALAVLMFGLSTLVLWPIVATSLPDDVVVLVTPIALLTGLVSLPMAALCYRPAGMVRWSGVLLTRVLPARIAARVAGRVDWWVRCFAAVGEISPGRWAQAAALCLVNLLVLSVSTMFSLSAAGVPSDPLGVVFMQALTAVASVAGVLVPGGFGAVEVLVVALFPTFAVGDTADAVFVAFALRWVHMLTLLLGVPAMLWLIATLPAEPEQLAPLFAESLRGELEGG
ncbi:MAG: lysylphosphatidylglycerol synthase transmembrane domain-containing protein [Pseudomonadota bacterium]|nr:lysylphosphatidylglycerol synthase transmembrane domain-containing protein [Pseudomonadota bacterium]